MTQASLHRLSALLVLLALLLGLTTACSPGDLETLAQTVGAAAALMESASATTETPEQPPSAPPEQAESSPTPKHVEAPAVGYGGEYSAAEDVALYLHLYRELPPNYLTKNEARDQGWDNSQGNLRDVVPGGCIGGDRFGNYEGLLPDGSWTECDVNYEGGYRNAERLVWNEDGAIYYTGDHYESFTLLYEGWAE